MSIGEFALEPDHVITGGLLGGSAVKNLPAMQDQSLGWENPLEEGMTTHSSILAWRIPWTEDPGGATVHRVAELDMTEMT